jgi:hypothetical protein
MTNRDRQNAVLFFYLLGMSFIMGFEVHKIMNEPSHPPHEHHPPRSNEHPSVHVRTDEGEERRSVGSDRTLQHRHPLPLHEGHRGHYHPHGMWKFRKIGFLTSREMGDPIIMPLFGEPAPYRRHRFNYYTVNDTHNALSAVNLPVHHKEYDCTQELACEELYSGDVVRVHGHDAPFVAEVY